MSNIIKKFEHLQTIAKYGVEGMRWGQRKDKLVQQMKENSEKHNDIRNQIYEANLSHKVGATNYPDKIKEAHEATHDWHSGLSAGYSHASELMARSANEDEAIDKIKENMKNIKEKYPEAGEHVLAGHEHASYNAMNILSVAKSKRKNK